MKKWVTGSITVIFCLAFSGCVPVKQQNIEEMQTRTKVCSIFNARAKEGCFSMERFGDATFPASREHQQLFPYLGINCHPVFSHFEPGVYYLYCPNTGCPIQPEYVMRFVCKPDGKMSCLASELEGNLPEDFNFEASISLWGIPGFCSDWYLIGEDAPHVYHATFVYEPIKASNEEGQSLVIYKKESGGNLLEICFSGFKADEEVYWSMSEGDLVICNKIKMDEAGCYTTLIQPKDGKKEKGTLVVSLDLPTKPLQASVDWDRRTLAVRRIQPRSQIMRSFLSFDRLNDVSVVKCK